jgi:hypothetical protein
MRTEDDLAAWVARLDDLFALVAGRFFRGVAAAPGEGLCAGLLAPLASKNGWRLAEAAGDATPDGMQRLLNQAAWDADGVRDDVRVSVCCCRSSMRSGGAYGIDNGAHRGRAWRRGPRYWPAGSDMAPAKRHHELFAAVAWQRWCPASGCRARGRPGRAS